MAGRVPAGGGERPTFGPWTKGLALGRPTTRSEAEDLTRGATIADETFTWPLLTLDANALEHNIALMAGVVADRGALHAPHVKTHMSPEIWALQEAAGAWATTVATPAQWRAARSWGARRILLANELVDRREAARWRAEAQRSVEGAAPPLETFAYVDSLAGVDVLAGAFTGSSPAVSGCLGVLIEVGVPGGRTGVRSVADAVDLARAASAAGLRVVGVAGYEGTVAGGTSPTDLAAVADWLRTLRTVGEQLAAGGLVGSGEGPSRLEAPRPVTGPVPGPLILSAGGSSFLDVVLDELAGPLPGGAPVRVVVRSGAYVIGDHGFYSRMDPFSRLGVGPLLPAATVWGQVLSVPEAGLAHVGVGRRDVGDDIDLPVVLGARSAREYTPDAPGADPGHVPGEGLGPLRPLPGVAVASLNDQHAHLRGDVTGLAPGDVVALGISHPCTTLDRWRIAALTSEDRVRGLVTFDL